MIHVSDQCQCKYLLVIQFYMSFTETFFSHSFAGFKIFVIYCVFKPVSRRTRIYWDYPFLSVIVFLSVTVTVQFENLFNMLCC